MKTVRPIGPSPNGLHERMHADGGFKVLTADGSMKVWTRLKRHMRENLVPSGVDSVGSSSSALQTEDIAVDGDNCVASVRTMPCSVIGLVPVPNDSSPQRSCCVAWTGGRTAASSQRFAVSWRNFMFLLSR